MAVSVYDVGDHAPLTLYVDEADSSTVATVAVLSPSGHESVLAAVPNAARDEWTTALRLAEAGVWRTTWTVTGLGAGIEHHEVVARARTAGRSYATSADLAAWPGVDTVPVDADRLLARATRLVDRVMVGARWRAAEGTDNLPADERVAAAYRDATCAQVAEWLEQGAGDYGDPDEGSAADDAAELAAWASSVGASSVNLGSLSIGLGGSRSSSSSSTSSGGGGVDYGTAADEAVDVLRTAGLFPPPVGVIG